MSETDVWREIARSLSLEFEPGLDPYLKRVDLLSRLQGKEADFDMGKIGGNLGGLMESMLSRIMVGMMLGNKDGFEAMVYRDVKHRIRSSQGLTDEYYVNCAVVFPRPYPFELEIKRGKGFLKRNRIKFNDPNLDKMLVGTSPKPGAAEELIRRSEFKKGVVELFGASGAFTVRDAGIVFQEKNSRITKELLADMITHMTDVAPRLCREM